LSLIAGFTASVLIAFIHEEAIFRTSRYDNRFSNTALSFTIFGSAEQIQSTSLNITNFFALITEATRDAVKSVYHLSIEFNIHQGTFQKYPVIIGISDSSISSIILVAIFDLTA